MSDLVLLLNAAEARVQVALFRREGQAVAEVLCEQSWYAPSRGTEIMPAAIGQMFDLLQVAPSDVTHIACTNGPGSFTGIRLVLSFAAAVRRGCGAVVGAVDIMQAIAMEAPAASNADRAWVRVLTHARRGLVHGRDFEVIDGMARALDEPHMWTLGQASRGLPGNGQPVRIVGSGVARNIGELDALLPESVERYPDIAYPSFATLETLALSAEYDDGDLAPVYLRPCDAVDNLPHIAELRGDRPEDVCAELDRLLSGKPASFEF